MAAVHRHKVYVDVDEEVRFGHAPVDLDVLALISLPYIDQASWVFGVVLQEPAVGRESIEDAVAQRVAQLGVGHAAVQPERGDEHHVVDASIGCQVEHRLDDPLAVVGPAHGRQWQGEVVKGDRQAHAGVQQFGERGAVAERLDQGAPDGRVGVGEGGQRFWRINDAAAVGGQAFEAETFPVPDEHGGCGAVYFEDEPGTGHQPASLSLIARFSFFRPGGRRRL